MLVVCGIAWLSFTKFVQTKSGSKTALSQGVFGLNYGNKYKNI